MDRLSLESMQVSIRRPEQTPDAVGLALAMGESMGAELELLAKRHRFGAIGVALFAGFALGVSPRLRRSLRSLLEG